jgi:hypothetical protein
MAVLLAIEMVTATVWSVPPSVVNLNALTEPLKPVPPRGALAKVTAPLQTPSGMALVSMVRAAPVALSCTHTTRRWATAVFVVKTAGGEIAEVKDARRSEYSKHPQNDQHHDQLDQGEPHLLAGRSRTCLSAHKAAHARDGLNDGTCLVACTDHIKRYR